MPDFSPILRDYLRKLELVRANPYSAPELSLRDALSAVLDATRIVLGKSAQFVGEPKKKGAKSLKPDYIITRSELPIGYIEAEKPEADLAALSGHSKTQNEAFIAEFDNFLLSNHFDFRLYDAKNLVARVELPQNAADLSPKHCADWQALFERFLVADFAPIKDPAQLAGVLARRAQGLARAIEDDLGDKGSYSSGAFDQFKRELLPNLHTDEFADLYAQTLAYGLFAARTLSDEAGFSVESAAKRLKAIPLLASLFRNFEAHLDDKLGWVLLEIVAVLKRAPIEAITGYFQKRQGRLDPMIDFYEPFLGTYDPQKRESRGVYYTPESVVGYIVRSVDCLLKRDFGKDAGLADETVEILDPATGTGSFLFATLDRIHDELETTGSWNALEAEKVLARVFGLELMVAPYAIAHLKLWLQLDAYGTPPKNRLGIYLSNTLDDPRQTIKGDFDLAQEVAFADGIKAQKPIRVVLGNPPYSGISANLNYKNGDKKQPTAVGTRIESYKTVDGVKMNERKTWVNNDYAKFIAFAQNRIEQTGDGIVAFITDNSYLDSGTFRGMRASLLDSFDALYILNLHGNSNKKEKTPDGSPDKNVFAIQQGVSILLAVRKKRAPNEIKPRAQVFHADLWGLEDEKHAALSNSDVLSTVWQSLTPQTPNYFFVPRDEELSPEYEKGWSVRDIFSLSGVGAVTARDKLTVAWTSDEILARVTDFASLSIEQARKKYLLGPDARDWKVETAIKDIQTSELSEAQVQRMLYRPFDIRWTYYTGKAKGFYASPCASVMRHLNRGGNIGLATTRNIETEGFQHVFCSRQMIQHHTVSIKEVNYLFPLHLYSEGLFGPEKHVNLRACLHKAVECDFL